MFVGMFKAIKNKFTDSSEVKEELEKIDQEE